MQRSIPIKPKAPLNPQANSAIDPSSVSSHPTAGGSYPASPISFIAPISQMPCCPPISEILFSLSPKLGMPSLALSVLSKSSQFLECLSITTFPRTLPQLPLTPRRPSSQSWMDIDLMWEL